MGECLINALLFEMEVLQMIDETNNTSRLDEVQEDFQVSETRYRRLFEAARDGIRNLDVVNEIRYRRLFEAARDGILMLDAVTRKITDANPFMVELLGYSWEEFLGKELWEIGLLKDEEASKTAFRELQEKGYIRYADLPLETKAGVRREVEFVSNVYSEGERQVIQCNVRDITGRKAAEQALTKLTGDLELAAQEYRRVLDHSLDVICQIDEAGRFIQVSPAAKKMWGYEPEELIGRRYMELVHPDDQAKTVQAAIDIMSGRSTTTFENCYLRKDGSSTHMMWSANWSEFDKTMFCVARDVSLIKQTEEALKASEGKQRLLSERQSAILNALPAHICLPSRRGNILDVNATWRQLLSERQSAILNALPAHICLLSRRGNILDVNAMWRQFAIENNFNGVNFGIGSNYLEVCESAPRDRFVEAEQTAKGIRSILSGKSNHFELEYACHSPQEKRWFHLAVTSLQENVSEGVVVMHVNITERKLEALRQAEARYRSMVESLPAIVYLAQPYSPYATIYVSPNIVELGYQPEEWFSRADMWVNLLHEEDRERVLRVTEDAMNRGLDTELEYRIVGRDGTIHWVHDKGRFVSDEHGNKISWQGVMVDITKTKELEEQLRQGQKLESVGRLAGGIAHDFNNMLTAINGYSDLMLRSLKADDPLRRNIEEIKKAGVRSASLTHQLLAFSRQQILQPRVLNLNGIITNTSDMLQRLIGEDVHLITILNSKAGQVKVDPGQLSQIIMNLAVNARDAMPQGGNLTIETANVVLDSDYTHQHASVPPGAYVMLAVSDTGTGMNAETQKHIFEPFFTTKDIGKGTGLVLCNLSF
jgi:PAS domain S-box-containing protein